MSTDFQTSDRLEESLRARFSLREERVEINDFEYRLILPQSAEDLLDEEAFVKDERMPYWADLWPSARGLARWIANQSSMEGRWVELGCGIALPSIVAKRRGAEIAASDHNEDALAFARANSMRNALHDLDVALLDWRTRRPAIGKFDVVIAADVLYEQRNAIALRELLPRIVAPAGKFVLADPGRRFLQQFQSQMRESGWRDVQVDTRVETQRTSNGDASSTIRIIQFERI
jgi:predicted nicotinamide N-methyase